MTNSKIFLDNPKRLILCPNLKSEKQSKMTIQRRQRQGWRQFVNYLDLLSREKKFHKRIKMISKRGWRQSLKKLSFLR